VVVRFARCSLTAVALAGCAAEPDDGPAPPDLQWLVDAYQAPPTAELDLARARAQLEEALPILGSVRALENVQFVLQSLEDASSGLVIRGLDRELTGDIDGHANVHVVCPGDGLDAAPDAARDGVLHLRILIREAAIQPVITGQADKCRLGKIPSGSLQQPAEAFGAELNGALAIHTGAALVLGRATPLRPIIRVEGTLSVAELPPLSHFDFRVPAADTLEVRVPIGAAHVILVLANDSIAIRERRGEWTCETVEGGACTPNF
jgi:hypothetical protein